MILALSVKFVKYFAAILLPITFLTVSSTGRYQFLFSLASADRVRIIHGPAVEPGRIQHIWLVVFATGIDPNPFVTGHHLTQGR